MEQWNKINLFLYEKNQQPWCAWFIIWIKSNDVLELYFCHFAQIAMPPSATETKFFDWSSTVHCLKCNRWLLGQTILIKILGYYIRYFSSISLIAICQMLWFPHFCSVAFHFLWFLVHLMWPVNANYQ